MSTNESVTSTYEYLESHTKWLELSEKVIKNFNLKVSNKTIRDSFAMAVRVYEGVCNGTSIVVARCDIDGWRDKVNCALIVIEGYGWFRASLEMLEDPWSVKHIEVTIEIAKNKRL